MEKTIYDAMTKALEKAEEEHDRASYLSESGGNAGIRKMNTNKAEWLRWVVYLAQHGLKALEEEEKLATEQELVEEEDKELICEHCPVSAEAIKLTKIKDDLIEELLDKADNLTECVESLQLTCEYECEQRETLIEQAKIKITKDASNFAHDHCWLDGSALVCSVEQLDEYLTGLIKE